MLSIHELTPATPKNSLRIHLQMDTKVVQSNLTSPVPLYDLFEVMFLGNFKLPKSPNFDVP